MFDLYTAIQCRRGTIQYSVLSMAKFSGGLMRRLKFFLMYEGVARDSVGVSLSQTFFSLNYTFKKNPVYCFISSRWRFGHCV